MNLAVCVLGLIGTLAFFTALQACSASVVNTEKGVEGYNADSEEESAYGIDDNNLDAAEDYRIVELSESEDGEDTDSDPAGGDAGNGGDGADPDDQAGDAAEEDGYGPDDSDGDGDELEDPPTPDAAVGGRPIPPFEKVYTTWTQSRESFWLHFGGLCSTLVSS